MKNLISGLFIAMVAFNASAMLVGEVDVQKALLSVNDGKKAQEDLKKEFEKKQKLLQADEEGIRKLQADFKKQELVMNEKSKAEKARAIEEKIMKIQQKQTEYQKEMQELEQKFKVPVLNKIRDIVNKVSADAGVDITFETTTAPILYAKSRKDLTEEVIAAYNKQNK